MQKLRPPRHKARPTFEACAKSKNNQTLQLRLLAAAVTIEDAERAYLNHGADHTFHIIAQSNHMNGNVTIDEMASLYDDTLRRAKETRCIYNDIRLSATICPLCKLRQVSQLDHYLAKSKYPEYTVTPANLVPSCSDCNRTKLNQAPTTQETQMLHPYFDDIDQGVWLHADVLQTSPPTLIFSVRPCNTWTAVTHKRVLHHFDTLHLAKLYSVYAGGELVQMDFLLRKLAASRDPNAVRSHLIEQAESRGAAERNCWQAAMYQALADSEWFCSGGHIQIRP